MLHCAFLLILCNLTSSLTPLSAHICLRMVQETFSWEFIISCICLLLC
jgi:hypothetical protein